MKPKLINKKRKEQIGPDGKKKKVLIERTGDWLCPKCKNLNFAFRLKCNRCQLSKGQTPQISNEQNQNQGQINIGNDPNLLNQLNLISKSKLLLREIQQQQQRVQQTPQNQINTVNQIANNNNNFQLLNNNLNYAMNMGINNCYNNINIYNLSPSQIEQLNQLNQQNQRYINSANNNINNYPIIPQLNQQLNQINKNNQLNNQNLAQSNNLNNQNLTQLQLNNQINRQITNNNNNQINNQLNNQINQQLLNRYHNLDPSFINRLNQQQKNQIVNNIDDYDNLSKGINLISLNNMNDFNKNVQNLGFNSNTSNVNNINHNNPLWNNNNNYDVGSIGEDAVCLRVVEPRLVVVLLPYLLRECLGLAALHESMGCLEPVDVWLELCGESMVVDAEHGRRVVAFGAYDGGDVESADGAVVDHPREEALRHWRRGGCVEVPSEWCYAADGVGTYALLSCQGVVEGLANEQSHFVERAA